MSHMAMQTFFASDLGMEAVEKFNKRLLILNGLSEEDVTSLKNKLIRNEIILDTEITVKGLQIPLYELLAFMDGIALYQVPMFYKDILSGEHQQDRAASLLVTPIEIDVVDKRPTCVYTLSGCYDKEGFKDLSETIKKTS